MFPTPPPSQGMTDAPAGDDVVLDFGLKAQARMLAYALGYFGVGLPLFLWVSFTRLPIWLGLGYLGLFTICWAVLLALHARVTRTEADLGGGALSGTDLSETGAKRALTDRLWRQGLGGGIWATALLIICISAAATGGENAQLLLMVCAGGAVGIIFFSAPVLIFLLIIGPVAMAGPVLAARAVPGSHDLANLMTGGLVLALALGFLLNRHLREHYQLAYAQVRLWKDREAAQTAARDLTDARIALMETLSREVRTGLSDIERNLLRGLTHLARAPGPRQPIEAAFHEATHLQAILVTTLDNDTAASGQLELEIDALDIDAKCSEIAERAAAEAQAKGLTFSFSAPALPDVGAAMGDAARVRQILEHLIDNAIAYTRQGRVEFRVLAPEAGFIRFEVVDSGPGLSRDELLTAFMPHSRIARTSAGTSGAGLGLSLSRVLAELMGGHVGAESTPDVGSKFWLDLPFDATAVRPVRPVHTEPADDPAPGTMLRVLLLTNDTLRAAQLRDTLEGLGHRCVTSTTRERALNLALKVPLDACVMSTGGFDSLSDASHRETLSAFVAALRQTRPDGAVQVLALLPDGNQAEALTAMGIDPLLQPPTREALSRALSRAA